MCAGGSASGRRRRGRGYPQSQWLTSTSSRCTACRRSIRPTRRCSTTSRSRFLPGRQDRRARLQRRGQVDACCGSWPASTPSTAARRSSRPARPSACSSRSPTSTRARTCAATSRTASPRRARCSTASTSWPPTTPTRPPTSSPRLQAQIDAADAWNLDTNVEYAMDALRLPAGRRRRHARSPAASAAASRCAGCCSARPTCCCSTSRPTTSTPSRSPGSSATSPSTRAPSWP